MHLLVERVSAGEEGQGGHQGEGGAPPSPTVTLVLLTETHVSVPVALRHARVVHHEEVHLKCVRAGPLYLGVGFGNLDKENKACYLIVVGTNELDNLYTTSVTGLGGRHVVLGRTGDR